MLVLRALTRMKISEAGFADRTWYGGIKNSFRGCIRCILTCSAPREFTAALASETNLLQPRGQQLPECLIQPRLPLDVGADVGAARRLLGAILMPRGPQLGIRVLSLCTIPQLVRSVCYPEMSKSTFANEALPLEAILPSPLALEKNEHIFNQHP
jgi:hypothetical protein